MSEEEYNIGDYWRSKAGILATANHGQVITNVKDLLELSRSAQNSALGFKNLGMEREARICQLKSEMFSARAKELAMPKCLVCGTVVNVRNYNHIGGNLWKCDSCNNWSWSEWRKLTYAS